MPRRSPPQDPSWHELARQHWPQYAATALIFLLMRLADPLEPVPGFIYHKSDAEYWRYSKVRERRRQSALLPAA